MILKLFPNSSLRTINFFDWKLLLLLWLLCVTFTGLGGEYPLNDDWIYSSGVAALLEGKNITYLSPVAPNLVLQVLWGWLFCTFGGGFSFVLLRVSTLVLSSIGLLAFYKLIITLTDSRQVAFAAGLILLANPIYYNLSFSFMTDIPFMGLLLVSLWQYALYFKRNRFIYRIIAATAAIAAFGIRQPGLMLWLVAELVILFDGVRSKKALLVFGLNLLGIFAVYMLMERGLKSTWIGTEYYLQAADATVLNNPLYGVVELAKRCVMAFFFVGLFALPLLPYTVSTTLSERWWRQSWFIILLIINVLLVFFLASVGRIYPYGGYTIYNFGLGTPLLPDFHHWRMRNFPQIPTAFVMAIGLILQLHSFILFRIIFESVRNWLLDYKLNKMDYVVILFTIPYAGIVFYWGFFDRYVLVLFVAVLYVVARICPYLLSLGRTQLIMITLMLWYASAGTKDYLSWNEAVKDKKDELLKTETINRSSITVGYAQDGWDSQGDFDENVPVFFFSWGEMDGFTTLDTVPYKRLLPGKGIFYFVEKKW